MKPNRETRKKNIIRERERLETGREMERRALERKSIVLNCIPNTSNLAEIRFSEKHAVLGKTESLKTRSSCNCKWIHTFLWHKRKRTDFFFFYADLIYCNCTSIVMFIRDGSSVFIFYSAFNLVLFSLRACLNELRCLSALSYASRLNIDWDH